ncbi:MAG TPA: dihydroorotate dehydrogenase [Longimicrobiales bacterium]|nr:dihydroorotate dehydrogenase [Longimicrobiales bacterium]
MNLRQEIFGAAFANPILLAGGTAGYGREVDGILDLDRLGGIVTKAVTPEPRAGNPPLRAAEYAAGMLNSIGLANVGLHAFRADKLPWLRDRLRSARVLVNVAGATVEDYIAVVEGLDAEEGFVAYELNVSCPNVKQGGAAFCARADLLEEVVGAVRARTRRPILVKLAPNLPDIGETASVAVDAGADGLTLINTFPGLLFDVHTRASVLGAGAGGVSGPAILPMGVHAVGQARRRVGVPIIGVGGIRTGEDAVQYLLAGASLVAVGTAAFADPRAPLRVLNELRRYGDRHGVEDVRALVGAGLVEGGKGTG